MAMHNMKDPNKEIILLEKKLDKMDNDLFKLIATDLVQHALESTGCEFEKSTYEGYINELREIYKDKIHELKSSLKKNKHTNA